VEIGWVFDDAVKEKHGWYLNNGVYLKQFDPNSNGWKTVTQLFYDHLDGRNLKIKKFMHKVWW